MNDTLRDKLKTLPASPGVYFHKSQSGEVIYVGKAAVLKNRVRQYFQSKNDFDIKTRALVDEIHDTDWIETDSEIDALFLESEMVKRYMPRYNILLRDDKSQTYVRIDMKSEWPVVSFTRNPADDGASYFGPFYSGFAVKKALRYLRKVFPYYIRQRTDRADLDVHIGLSPASDMTSEEYKKNLKRLIKYIEGSKVAITNEIERDMRRAARDEQFEEAARLRNKLTYLKELQRRIMFGDKEFLNISKDKALTDLADILGLSRAPRRIEGYDISHMSGVDVVASMVVFMNGVSDRGQYRKFKMSVQRNDDTANMKETLNRRFSDKNIKAWGVPDLVLTDGGKGQLNAALLSMEERGVTVPCISIAKREEVIIIDRHRSNIALDALDDPKLAEANGVFVESVGQYTMINLHAGQRNASAHSRNLRGGDVLSRYSDIVKLFQRIRDESHRFAVAYHSTLKRQRQTSSKLDDIPGVGPVTRKKLIKHFGSVKGVSAAPVEEITAIIGAKLAREVQRHLSGA